MTTDDDKTTQPAAPLLPTREELQPGAERAARELLATLAEGSIVVVDEGRAMAVLAEVVVLMHQGAAQETARACAAVLEQSAARMTRPTAQAALSGAAGILRRGYGLPAPVAADGEGGTKQ